MVADEGGGNYNAVKEVFGQDFVDNKFYGCQWHFDSDAQRKVHSIPIEADHNRFISLTKQLVKCTTVYQYNCTMNELKKMAKIYTTLEPWLKWWHS